MVALTFAKRFHVKNYNWQCQKFEIEIIINYNLKF